MSSEEHYDSDYDTRPEAGRVKQHLDSDESDNERSSGPRRPLPFLNDDGDDDDDDEAPMTVEERSPSVPASGSAAAVNPIRQPTAFAAPDPTTSSGPTFYYKDKDKKTTPTHAAVSADGTSMFCVEGYVNTPELSAGRGGGLSQGLPANGPYKSLFRARSRSASRGSTGNKAASASSTTALHVLAEAAQSPEALSPVSTLASPVPVPAPVPTSKRRRKPSPLIASSSPASSVVPLDSVSALRPSPVASTIASSSSHVVIDPSPPPRQPRAKPAGGGGGSNTAGKGKHKEKVPPPAPAAQTNENGESEQRYERRSLPRQQSGSPFPVAAAELHEMESTTMQGRRARNQQKNKAGSKDGGPFPPPPPASADDNGNYDHAESDYPSYYEAEPSASDTVREGEQSLSPAPPKIWESSRPSPPVVNHHPASARTTSKESSPALMANSRSQTPGTKLRMITLLIEDRRYGTDELAEVHVPLKTVGEGYLWADAKEVCAALQSGPSRIDGPAKVFTMRGKYRQTFLRVSADGEETSQSANLKVETDRTLPIVVEGISEPRVVISGSFPSSNTSSLVSTGLAGPMMDTAHPLTPVSNHLDLDGIHTTPPDHKEVGQRSGGARKRKRETSLRRIQQSPCGSPESRNLSDTIDATASPPARSMPSSHEHYDRPWKSKRGNPISSFDGGYMSDSPPTAYRSQRVQRRDQTHPGSRLDRSGYETDQPLPSVRARLSRGMTAAQEQHQGSERRMSSLLQPPPTPVEDSRRMHDKVVSFLQDNLMEDTLHWNEFARDRVHVGSLSNAALLRAYWFAQGRLDTWVGSRLPKHLNYKKVEVGHVLDALGVSEDWYRECNETLSLVIAYGERGERWESPRAVAASRDHAPKSRVGVGRSGSSEFLALLREVHEEYCERVRGRNGRAGE